jgi:hypothetical protein
MKQFGNDALSRATPLGTLLLLSYFLALNS